MSTEDVLALAEDRSGSFSKLFSYAMVCHRVVGKRMAPKLLKPKTVALDKRIVFLDM